MTKAFVLVIHTKKDNKFHDVQVFSAYDKMQKHIAQYWSNTHYNHEFYECIMDLGV